MAPAAASDLEHLRREADGGTGRDPERGHRRVRADER
jgi:hypothetical protein